MDLWGFDDGRDRAHAAAVTASGGRHVHHPPHPHQDRSVRDRKRRAGLEDGMRSAHDPAKGLHFGKALALPRRARIHLVLGMGERSRDRGLSQQRRPQGDRAAYARTERGEGGGQALRPSAIGPKGCGPGASPVPDSTWGALEFLEYPSSSDRGGDEGSEADEDCDEDGAVVVMEKFATFFVVALSALIISSYWHWWQHVGGGGSSLMLLY